MAHFSNYLYPSFLWGTNSPQILSRQKQMYCKIIDLLNTVIRTIVIRRWREESDGGMWIWQRGVGNWSSVWRGEREREREMVENMPTFRYLGRPLDQTDDDWPAVRWNIMHARSVWGIPGMLL